jgi:ribosomal protein S18 acetylase RimI-like enzyme
MSESYQITCCGVNERGDALRVLHAGLDEDGQVGLLHALNAVGNQDELAFAGLLVAQSGGGFLAGTELPAAELPIIGLHAAVWVQLLPGRTAVVWTPAAGHPASPGLMRAAADYLDANDVVVAQILASPEAPTDQTMLAAGDFQQLANLIYLSVGPSHFPPVPPEGSLQFERCAERQPERLGKLLLRTYDDSLDCPALNGVRTPGDIVRGYAAQSAKDAQQWYFVRHNDQDVGTLILASHLQGGNWELVYMGIVPQARGQGFGWQILQCALWQAKSGHGQRMVLAVDEANVYALRTYRQAGFIVWDRRTVFARVRKTPEP